MLQVHCEHLIYVISHCGVQFNSMVAFQPPLKSFKKNSVEYPDGVLSHPPTTTTTVPLDKRRQYSLHYVQNSKKIERIQTH